VLLKSPAEIFSWFQYDDLAVILNNFYSVKKSDDFGLAVKLFAK
jgi:hypothetical protein